MHFLYIIQSKLDNSYYVGETADLKMRLQLHNSIERNVGVTRLKIPWEYFYTLQVENATIAKKIEKHIKRMKSTVYIQNLKKYPEITQRLIEKYS